MKRRHFIATTGQSIASLLLAKSLMGFSKQDSPEEVISYPNQVSATVNNQPVNLTGNTNRWENGNLVVELIQKSNSILIEIQSPKQRLSAVTLMWPIPIVKPSSVLNDQWERTYGDASWHSPHDELLPWYFMEYNGKTTNGFGVKTGTRAFCYWKIVDGNLYLTLDTQSGGNGVNLGDRKLSAAEIVTIKGAEGETPFQVTQRFTQHMCDKPRLSRQPVYGINDWYFTYGNNSEKLILEHTQLMAPLAAGLSNRPFSVIDAGWFQSASSLPNESCWGNDMNTPDDKFGDMGKLAEKIRALGMRPGIWTRPLCGSEKDAASLFLPLIKGRVGNEPILDPTLPENLDRVKSYFRLYNAWGYEMVKFDYTSFDIFGKWGFEMLRDGAMTESNWSMHDTSLTNAEIVLQLYEVIREAAGDTYIIGCNTISHLSAGLFELNRIGDDTSGNEWARTRKMGVNTLAFRGVTNGMFYAADPDCVGLTTKIDWEKNKQWMELVAKSGTPLFLSAQPAAVGEKQKKSIKACFKLASSNLPTGEPLDWIENPVPKIWKLNGQKEVFNWD